MKRFFITASGTDIGKTLVTAALTWQMRAKGLRVKAIKPVASGFVATHARHSDTMQLLEAQDLPPRDIDAISPWRFAAPVSPDIAAKLEGRNVKFDDIIRFCEAHHHADVLLIEGIGGVMTPLTEEHTVLELIDALEIPSIMVCGSYVGTINHTLTAFAAMQTRSMCPLKLIISESEHSATTLAQTQESLERHMLHKIPVQTIARLDLVSQMWKNAPDLTDGLL